MGTRAQPWSVDATYDGAPSSSSRESFSADLRPDGTTLRVSGATPFRAVLTHAFADDVIAATARARRADAAVPARRPVVNALGVDAWVRTDGGRVTRVPPGATLPRGSGRNLPAARAPTIGSRRARRGTYLLVEFSRRIGANRIGTETDRDDRIRIVRSIRALSPGAVGIDSVHPGRRYRRRAVCRVRSRGRRRAPRLVDVTPWRVRRDARVSTLTPLRVRCELAPPLQSRRRRRVRGARRGRAGYRHGVARHRVPGGRVRSRAGMVSVRI